MDILLKIVLVFIMAFLAAVVLSLIKIGASELFRYAENKWGKPGAVGIIILWLVAFPLLVIVSFTFGCYRVLSFYGPKLIHK